MLELNRSAKVEFKFRAALTVFGSKDLTDFEVFTAQTERYRSVTELWRSVKTTTLRS